MAGFSLFTDASLPLTVGDGECVFIASDGVLSVPGADAATAWGLSRVTVLGDLFAGFPFGAADLNGSLLQLLAGQSGTIAAAGLSTIAVTAPIGPRSRMRG